MCVPLLVLSPPPLPPLAGARADITGENGNGDGDSVEEGECDSGVVVSDMVCNGRRIDDVGTPCDGIGTACVAVDRDGTYPTDVLGDDTPEVDDRRCVGCEYGSIGVNPTRLSTDNPSCRHDVSQSVNDHTTPPTHPSSQLQQLLPINIIQPRNPHVIPLRIHQPIPQLLVLSSHRFQHDLDARCRRIVHARRRGRVRRTPLLLWSLCTPEREQFPVKSVHVRLALGFERVLELNLFLTELQRGVKDV